MALLEHESNLDEDDSMSNTLFENLENDEEMAQQHKNNSDIDDKPYTCKICKKGFPRMTNLKRHIDSVHEGKKPYKCQRCDANFGQKSGMKKHLKVVHDEENPVSGFDYLIELSVNDKEIPPKEHIESDHDGQKPFICTVCQKRFTTKLNLKVHIETVHEGKKPFECPICKKSFTQKNAMTRHINSLHEEIDEKLKPYICDLCNASFARQSHLKGHINSTHDKKTAEISEQDIQIKKIKIIDPAIIKEEHFDTISEDNGDLNFSGITGKSLSEALLFAEHGENMLCT